VNLPDAIKPKTKTDTKRAYEFTHKYDNVILDSSIYVATGLRGGTVRRLHVTESAFHKNRQELNAGSKQAVPKDGFISEETTGNGYNEFYDFYMEYRYKKAIGQYDYKTYFYAWFENPEYFIDGLLDNPTKLEVELKDKYHLVDEQLLWRRWKMQELKKSNFGFGLTGEQLFKQEYPATVLEAFQSGAGNVFDLEKLDSIQPIEPLTESQMVVLLSEMYADSPETIQHFAKTVHNFIQRGVRFWELPIVGQKYVIGCDPSDGQGSDFGPIDVWTRPREMEAKRQVAQFYGKLLPHELAELIKDLGNFYNKAFAGVENNMLTTISHLVQIYDSYYQTFRMDEKTKVRTKKIGWNTNSQSREYMIDEFLIDFEEDHLVIRSGITLSEMRTFVKKELPGGRYKREHANGKFDDALFSAFIANQMAKHQIPTARVFSK